MTSISAASAGNYQSPLQRLQQQLQSDVSDGTISSSDQSALSTALTDIDTALQSSRSGDQSSGTRPSKDEVKSKIDDLIANEVSNGTLTSDQADELKNVFQSAFAKGPGGAGGPGGPGGPGGAGGPPPGPPPDDSSSDSSSTDSTSSTSTNTTTADILQQFLQALQQSQSSSASYGANGSSFGGSDFSALLIDFKS
ncbi:MULTISPECIES: hypothetical protein [Bradyrhizobium]|uniref:hypothetical protein n=1 Tax=Bradyrhizobium TaxID=374 RepID=UPI000231C687|nr:hypothetical protein [Bradyrhizobium japonicum]AJA61292.1 hypothetical protein RN69_13555 [Bradyrhizobium japonicum]KMJ99430.1 hypothetical protein CF64_09575 [Bradyrhizobium japonicum]MBR0762484.1 hypothetical protein [Bradyrhizobium japonicum]MCP1763729.1 hypothetical protein [Bradyrhizobium japonicum]MCP1785866.1 hypothetical protein [Bradyrhizobium japonicum]